MIRQIELINFRSILRDTVHFQPLTVIIGANGSGKSNLIKSLEFLSIIANEGVIEAVNSFGGFSAVVPKAVAESEVRKTRVSLNVQVENTQISHGRSNYGVPEEDHYIELAQSPSEGVRISREEIKFKHALLTVDPKLPLLEKGPGLSMQALVESEVIVTRQARRKPVIKLVPEFTDSPSMFSAWMGFPYFSRKYRARSFSELEGVALRFRRQTFSRKRRGTYWSYKSLIEPEAETIISSASQMAVYRRELANIRRYDLLLNELRDDQRAGDQLRLNSSGNNMPSVLKRIKKDKIAWERILTTMEAINPSVNNLISSSLRTGKQYIDFVEKPSKRSVESWQMSDGTLRALAIILALETHPKFSTILIEEPEQNLHPWALEPIVRHMRELIDINNLQIILTTHSKHVLEAVSAEEVLVASRDKVRGTHYSTIGELVPGQKLLMGEVGDMWVRGLLGGHPIYE